jgi:hypothetical protein
MHFFRHIYLGFSIATLLGLAACGSATVEKGPAYFVAQLSGGNEVPAVVTQATGTVEATLMPETLLLTWRVSYAGLSGPLTGAHFHGPAMPGQNAGVVMLIGGPQASTLNGSATLSPSQAADLMAGRWYVNLHTAANPDGEIRGQVNIRP